MVYNIIGYNDSTILTKNLCLVSFSWTFSASLSCSLLFTFIRLIISMIYVKIKNIGANFIYLISIYLSIYRSTAFQSIIILQKVKFFYNQGRPVRLLQIAHIVSLGLSILNTAWRFPNHLGTIKKVSQFCNSSHRISSWLSI